MSQHIVSTAWSTKRKRPVPNPINTVGLSAMQRMLAQEGRRNKNSLVSWPFAECGEVNEARTNKEGRHAASRAGRKQGGALSRSADFILLLTQRGPQPVSTKL